MCSSLQCCVCTHVILFDEGAEYKRVCLCVCEWLYVAVVFSSLYFLSQLYCLAAALRLAQRLKMGMLRG